MVIYHIFLSKQFCPYVNTEVPQRYQPMGRYRDKIVITWYQASLSIEQCMPFSISGLLSSLKALWPISVSRDDNSPDMEKGMH